MTWYSLTNGYSETLKLPANGTRLSRRNKIEISESKEKIVTGI